VADAVIGWHHCSAGLLPYLSASPHYHTTNDDDNVKQSMHAAETDFDTVKRDVIQVSLL